VPLPLPSLDDRTFDQLLAEGRALIPRYSAAWTNHNPSDPGITLVELFAYVTEAALYQLDQVPAASVEQFLRLLGATRERTGGEAEPLEQALARALAALVGPTRAVTAADFDILARAAAARMGTPLARTAFTLHRDVACAPPDHPEQAPSAALIIVVPDEPDTPRPVPSAALIRALLGALRERCPLATRVQVVGPEYVRVGVDVAVVRRTGSGLQPAVVEQAVRAFLDPLRGGTEGAGWPFGRPVYYSELFQRLESLAPVDHVERLALETSPPGASTSEGIAIPPWALVAADPVTVQVAD